MHKSDDEKLASALSDAIRRRESAKNEMFFADNGRVFWGDVVQWKAAQAADGINKFLPIWSVSFICHSNKATELAEGLNVCMLDERLDAISVANAKVDIARKSLRDITV